VRNSLWQNVPLHGNLRISNVLHAFRKCVNFLYQLVVTVGTDRKTIRRDVVRQQTRQILIQAYDTILDPSSR